MIGPIPLDLEGFFITMATILNLSKNDPRVMFLSVSSFPVMYDSPGSVPKPPRRCKSTFQIFKDFPLLSIDTKDQINIMKALFLPWVAT